MNDNPCDHEAQRTARLLRTESLRRFDADAIGGHFEVVWCEKCGALKEAKDEWTLPTSLDAKSIADALEAKDTRITELEARVTELEDARTRALGLDPDKWRMK